MLEELSHKWHIKQTKWWALSNENKTLNSANRKVTSKQRGAGHCEICLNYKMAMMDEGVVSILLAAEVQWHLCSDYKKKTVTNLIKKGNLKINSCS